MYNVGFGDCYCLRDRKKSLLVDFGTNNSRIEGRPRREIFDLIISDLSTIECKNLLLTHFHMDHLSGLLYMMKNKDSSFDFGKIYLPDVFSEEKMSRTLVLLLLADLVKDSCLPSRQVSLFALIDALLERQTQTVELLGRGKIFEEKYQALWPDAYVTQRETNEVYDLLKEKFPEIMDVLLDFAEKLRQIIWSMTDKGKVLLENNQKNIRAYVYEREFRRIKALPEFKELLTWLNRNQVNLRQFKHKISIVFQNARDGELNLLFTGDVQPEHMQMIADNYDGKWPLYEHYWCIKVPHHGTQDHYFNFSGYEPENMMISNGIHFANSKTQSRELRTSPLYGGLFYIPDTHMYCSNCDCCDCYENGCSCKEADVISPSYYKDI
ncbi:MBL fold metallo-hydrolase [Blautia difficilis]|uniref:MBL fold metallo-hydrolase n=1 Tax=Blautia difficilis TaxID=2763027 RepID=A0ABR7IH16_9FIRM|nr:MBL fold metallo-hydrolase [Blautia difficilis]MBC5779323.1 MBL fold metallo-hydrolase [Blautia difficilis]